VELGEPADEIVRFIVDHLATVPHLEALLLIWQNPSTGWTADVLAGRIYVSQPVARGILEDFLRNGIVRSEGEPEPIYLFERQWDAQRQLLPRLADLYRRQLVQVTKLIHSKGSSSVREFARAFQIKKDH
jgi:DNA-binding MarR family transcriptional regulator